MRYVLLAIALLLAGCTITTRTMRPGVIVYDPPPPARVSVQMAPYEGAVWVDGYWAWDGGSWYWVDGHWEAPRNGYVYVQPNWQRRGTSWVFVPGRWHGRTYRQPRRNNVVVGQPRRNDVVVGQPQRGGVQVGQPRPRRGTVTVEH